jgi:hypothetical protein
LCRSDDLAWIESAFGETLTSKALTAEIPEEFAEIAEKQIEEKTTMKIEKLGMLAVVVVAVIVTAGAGKSQTFTGEVSDAMCGAKHMMPGNADCLRTCVSKGANYALIVGDKVYTLHTKDEGTRKTLDSLASEKAKVTGTADGETIEVSSVAAAK